ncbi:hypothetical protein B0H14DRAFT_2615227 [Mycena olivaceomarginata]|nr:hypothetical protein B0H14DRAFT_2615227 [Mycena olivaceomarginata]
MDELKRELQERNTEIRPVLGTPTWVRRAKQWLASAITAGAKPRLAGSIFFRLESREKVDVAVAGRRLVLAGAAPTVVRGFPHLRITQCWGCLKFGHVKTRCSMKGTKCGGCDREGRKANTLESEFVGVGRAEGSALGRLCEGLRDQTGKEGRLREADDSARLPRRSVVSERQSGL